MSEEEKVTFWKKDGVYGISKNSVVMVRIYKDRTEPTEDFHKDKLALSSKGILNQTEKTFLQEIYKMINVDLGSVEEDWEITIAPPAIEDNGEEE